LIKHCFLRHTPWMIAFAIACVGCSSSGNKVTGQTDNNFDQSSYDFRLYKNHENYLADQLKEEDITYIKYGDSRTLVIPADKYFSLQSTELTDMDYSGFNNIVKLLKLYPNSQIYVAAFSDDSGSANSQKDLTQGRAEKMVTFLWANGIPANKLSAQGYGDTYSIGSNKQMHSSSYNRRIEIQWSKPVKSCCPTPPST